jgi:hypothetical protein
LTSATIVSGADTLTTTSIIPRVSASGVLGPSGLKDDLTNIYDTAARNWGIGTWARNAKKQ